MIDVALTRAQMQPARMTVVIDALRATSTAVAALGAGYRRVLFAATLEDALALRGPGRVLAGERRCVMPVGFDHGNSPADAALRRGDELVLATTNGTPAIAAATRLSDTVLLASMPNLAATVQWLLEAGGDVQLACSGADGGPALEDVYVAGAIASALTGARTDATLLAEAVFGRYGDPLSAFAAGAGAARLREVGLARDIADCARQSLLPVVAIAVRCGERGASATVSRVRGRGVNVAAAV